VGSVDGWVYKTGVVIVEGGGAVLEVNFGHPIVTNGDFATRVFPNYFGQDLFNFMLRHYETYLLTFCTDGCGSVSVAEAEVWSVLCIRSADAVSASSLPVFKNRLKTYLFHPSIHPSIHLYLSNDKQFKCK